MSEPIYLDNHAASCPFPECIDRFSRSSREYWGAIDSPHFVGQQQVYPLQKSVDSILASLGAEENDEVFFTGGGSEGNYHVFFNTYLKIARQTGKTLFLTSLLEEESTIRSLEQMEELGCAIKMLSTNSKGQITKEILEEAITPRTAIFSLSWANGLTGVIHPVCDLAEVCKEKNILFHLDASYVLGKSFFRFQDLGAHFLTLEGSVIHSLPGTGLVLAKAGSRIQPAISSKGGAVASGAALTEACLEMQDKFEHYCMEIARLRDLLETEVLGGFSEAIVLFKEADRLPNCCVIAFPGVYSEALLYLLNAKGVYASSGGGKFQSLEKMLLSIGEDRMIASSALSFSLSWDTTEEDIENAAERIIACVKQLKTCSKELV